jgi:hypothetical protein
MYVFSKVNACLLKAITKSSFIRQIAPLSKTHSVSGLGIQGIVPSLTEFVSQREPTNKCIADRE